MRVGGSQKIVKKSTYWHKHKHGGGWIPPGLLHRDRKAVPSQTVWFGSVSEAFEAFKRARRGW